MIGPVSLDRDLRQLPEIAQRGEDEEEGPMKRHPFPRRGVPAKTDPIQAVRRSIAAAIHMPGPTATFPGINSVQSGCNCLPPDTNGDVGPNHYIQTVNTRFKIMDKAGNRTSCADYLQFLLLRDGPDDSLRRKPKPR